MVGLGEFLSAVEWNRSRIREYVWGADGAGGECDCIGLIIGALRHLGVSWPWTHGTNYTARNRMQKMRAVSKADELSVGELVFKAHSPDADDWALPSTYKNHANQKDYYHVGVVMSVSPLRILHCTSVAGGIKEDVAMGRWGWAGEIDLVDYGGGGEKTMNADVLAIYRVTGGRLALRSSAKKAENNFVKWLPDGARVYGLKEPENGWVQVEHEGTRGYCLAEYLIDLEMEPDEGASTPPATEAETSVKIPREAAEMIYAALGEALGGIG